MNQSLTVIIPCYGPASQDQLADTLRSFNTVTPLHAPIRIVVVDDANEKSFCRDCLAKLVPKFSFTVLRNVNRLGCAASRQIAADREQSIHHGSDWFLFTDCHMVFTPNWYLSFCDAAENLDGEIFCGTYIPQLPDGSWLAPMAGAEFFFFREQFRTGSGIRVMELDPLFEPNLLEISNPQPTGFNHIEIGEKLRRAVPAMIGATYFVTKSLFTKLRGFEGLKGYGSDEAFLSIKAWLAGYPSRVLRNVRIRHLAQKNHASRDSQVLMLYNKLLMLELLFPEWKKQVMALFPPCPFLEEAQFELAKATSLIMELSEYFKTIFIRTPEDYCKEFGIETPAETFNYKGAAAP